MKRLYFKDLAGRYFLQYTRGKKLCTGGVLGLIYRKENGDLIKAVFPKPRQFFEAVLRDLDKAEKEARK